MFLLTNIAMAALAVWLPSFTIIIIIIIIIIFFLMIIFGAVTSPKVT